MKTIFKLAYKLEPNIETMKVVGNKLHVHQLLPLVFKIFKIFNPVTSIEVKYIEKWTSFI